MSPSSPLANKSPARGGLWIVFGLCLLIGGGALAVEYMRPHGGAFWLADTPGLRAGIGLGAAFGVAVVGWLARLLLARPDGEAPKGGRDAGDRA
jgi:hypothetical protein